MSNITGLVPAAGYATKMKGKTEITFILSGDFGVNPEFYTKG
jgi:hypothetical protein